ncbi:hypothetical protein [Cecembia calidifontis]|uniref:hypothetical protein n=1 Tax=Cecembia calidifontis TaxID=1187080 RepID=UPI0013EE79F1|nr:hypothetical protein [Cecembia calidifontis]
MSFLVNLGGGWAWSKVNKKNCFYDFRNLGFVVAFDISTVVLRLPVTFGGFAKAGLFSTTVHLKNRTSIIRKNCQPKHCTPAFAKPLLQAGVLVFRCFFEIVHKFACRL